MDNLILDQQATDWENPERYVANKGTRFLNFLIDRMVIFGIYVILFSILFARENLFQEDNSMLLGILWISFYFSTFFYYSITEAVWGKSVGKMLTRTKIVTTSGKRPELMTILGRSLCRYIPFEPFSVLFSDFPRGWHDSIPRILVVDDRYPSEDSW
ncbi:MAG: RDD family protein [Saprospiraceae bacterium]|nr:RDD family protein [Saprospiraceae bacterium]MCB9322002.1 RDD family protein [Lewinellaceae bacterium]